jgi:hypothetical protein
MLDFFSDNGSVAVLFFSLLAAICVLITRRLITQESLNKSKDFVNAAYPL